MLRFLTWTFTITVALVLTGAVTFLGVLYYFGRGLPDYEQLVEYEPPVVSRFYAGDGRLFAEYATQKRFFVPIKSIPKLVIQTFLSAEDKNFYDHSGLDFFGIMRAALTNISKIGTNKRPMGASTITQQVAKNLLLSSIATQASFDRKIKEAILAFRIEKALTKDRILELYLNEIYLGGGSYGVGAAALNYFNKSLDELTIAESAFLAALPKAPSRYNPKTNYEAAKARRDWVITRMFEDGVISREEAITAKQQPIELKRPDPAHVVKADYFAEEVRRHLVMREGEKALYQGGLTVRTTLDPSLQKFADKALRQGLINYDRRHGWRGAFEHIDLKNKSNWQEELANVIDPPGKKNWQVAIVLELTDKAAGIGLKSGEKGSIPFSELTWARKNLGIRKSQNADRDVYNVSLGPAVKHPKDVLQVGDLILVDSLEGKDHQYSLQQIPAVSGAFIAMDPNTGRVLAMSGGFSFEISQFNRVSQALRQPGSAIKPFIYLAAMERGFSPATLVSDSPISIVMGRGLGTYSPKNVTANYYGVVPLRIGLQKSLNMLTIRLVHEYVGMKPVADLIKKFGIMEHVPMQIAMALGAGETTLLKMATAYGILANGGKELEPTLIDRIQDRHGNTIFVADKRNCPDCKQSQWVGQHPPQIEDQRNLLVDPRSVYQVTSMLEGAVRAGSARRAQSLNRILAAKTGTTNQEKDAWSFAYTPDLVVGTYIGFDGPQPLGHMEGGARVALPILIDFLSKALEGIPNKPIKMPSGMKLVRMNEMTGQPTSQGPNVIYEVFKVDQSFRDYQPTFGQNEPIGLGDDDISRIIDLDQKPRQEPRQINQPSPFTGTGGVY